MSTVTGPDFLALQVRDLERAATFDEQKLGLRRALASPPGAVVFATEPIAFAVACRYPAPTLTPDVPASASRCGCAPRTRRQCTTSSPPRTSRS